MATTPPRRKRRQYKPPVLKCQHCHRWFRNRSGLTQHTNAVHQKLFSFQPTPMDIAAANAINNPDAQSLGECGDPWLDGGQDDGDIGMQDIGYIGESNNDYKLEVIMMNFSKMS